MAMIKGRLVEIHYVECCMLNVEEDYFRLSNILFAKNKKFEKNQPLKGNAWVLAIAARYCLFAFNYLPFHYSLLPVHYCLFTIPRATLPPDK